MINSRKLEDLLLPVAARARQFIEYSRVNGINLVVTSTYRDIESQNELYAQGRTKPGKIVTNAKGGESFHNWKVALDVVPVVNGIAQWDNTSAAGLALWNRVGSYGEKFGLEWAGRWNGKLKETAHFQYTGGLSLADLKAGMVPK